MPIYIAIFIPKHPVDELFDDSPSINPFLLQPLLIEKDDLVFFAEIPGHTSCKSIHKLVSPSNFDDEILVNLLLQKETAVIVFLVCFDKLFELSHSRLKREEEGKMSEELLDTHGTLTEKEVLKLRT
jgi:hypothetical protein